MKTELIETDQVNLTRTQSANKIPYGFDDMRKIIDEKNESIRLTIKSQALKAEKFWIGDRSDKAHRNRRPRRRQGLFDKRSSWLVRSAGLLHGVD